MKALDGVTLLSFLTSTDGAVDVEDRSVGILDATLRSLRHSASKMDFGAVKLIAPVDEKIDGIEVDTIDSIPTEGYSRFCVEELVNHVDTEYCLCVQWDSAIIDEQLWDDSFLSYDYIGPPWHTHNGYKNRVGNGGFSLRSKKFLEEASSVTYDPLTPCPWTATRGGCVTEDWLLCVYNYEHMLEKGVKFADPVTAARFAVEHPLDEKFYFRDKIDTYESFGFHGAFNVAGMEQIK